MHDLPRLKRPSAHTQRGNVIVGLSIAMLAAGILVLGSAKVAMNTFKDSSGTVIGNQLQVVSTGLSSYVTANTAALISGAAITGVAAPLSPTVPELISLRFLNSGVTITPTVGGSYNIGVSVTPKGCTTDCQVIGSVYLANPIYTADNSETDIRLLGAAMAASKSSQIGFSHPTSPSLITGSGWSFANPDPQQRAGILYATTVSSSSVGALYWLQSAATLADLPSTGNALGDGRLTRDTGKGFIWKGTAWEEMFNFDSLVLTSIGTGSGKAGTNSVYIGQNSGSSNTTGGSNVFTGQDAGRSNTTGSSNVFTGQNTGYSNTTGGSNVFTGQDAGYSNTTGGSNVFTGRLAGTSNTTGSSNVFTGTFAGRFNTTGSTNVFTGQYAGLYNTTGNFNVFTGYSAGLRNTTGNSNVFTGRLAGSSNTTGNSNVFTGELAGRLNDTGSYNIFTGQSAGLSNTWGNYNIFTGQSAGYDNTSGSHNIFTGPWAGLRNTDGNYNIFTGKSAGQFNSGGSYNVFTGKEAGYFNTGGNSNVFTGKDAGYSNSWGSNNVFVGTMAGTHNTTGGSNTYLGHGAGYDTNFDNATAIGSLARPTASNTVRIGNTTITQIGGQVAWSNLSDRRLKTDIKDSSYGMDFVRKLRAVDFTLKDNQKHETGFIAQEVEGIDASFPGLNKPASDKDFYSLTYTDFIPSMVKAIQELDARTSISAAAGLQTTVSVLSWATALLGSLVLILGGCVFFLWSRLNEVIANQRSAAFAL